MTMISKDGEDGGLLDSNKNITFTNKITKDDIRKIISGVIRVANGTAIQAAAGYLRKAKRANKENKKTEFGKRDEEKFLEEFATKNGIWRIEPNKSELAGEGAEQRIYELDQRTVIKFNDAIFYTSWIDYFNSLLLHNFFFRGTAYKLLGFSKKDKNLRAAVSQPIIKADRGASREVVRTFMKSAGFIPIRNDDYYNSNLGLILEDLHDQNVLIDNAGILYFIDTVFYLSDKKP